MAKLSMTEGERLPVGWRKQHLSRALNPSHTTPRSPVSTNVTKAPARSDGRALARRTTCLIPGGVRSTRGGATARGMALVWRAMLRIPSRNSWKPWSCARLFPAQASRSAIQA